MIALVLLIAVALAVAVAGAGNTPPRHGAPTAWQKNKHGVTYGSGLKAESVEDEPDLILVEASNGKLGYAYRTDLEGADPSSPAAAVAKQKAEEGTTDLIPVYEVDGVTRIGSFVIHHPKGIYPGNQGLNE